jgi:predicted  nucleic acid-binding Zn-ribbon protein
LKDFDKLQTQLKGIATLDDLKKLYHKVNPALKSSEE